MMKWKLTDWVFAPFAARALGWGRDAPPKSDDAKGIKGWVMKRVMQRAGAGVPSADRITLLRDANGDGIAETRTTFLDKLVCRRMC